MRRAGGLSAHEASVSASKPQGAPSEPLLAIIRGPRLRPVILQHYVQPNALILHLRH